ncbi:MAG: hypothetical protein ABIS14_16015, partial [Sphingomonas sp.]
MSSVLDRWCDRSDRLPLILLIVFCAVVAVAGGSSRADVLGQAVVRGAAILFIAALVASGARIDSKTYRPLFLILAACVGLITLELVPLPPALWAGLPGRAMFLSAAQEAGLSAPWRPIAIYPDGAVNALFSLLVPVAMLSGVAALGPRGIRQLLPIVIAWVAVSAFNTLLQASGGWFANSFINDENRQYAGLFANRNHDALFLAIGTAASAYWGFGTRRRTSLRLSLAVGLIALFFLTNLVTGSRSGLILELIATGIGLGTINVFARDETRTSVRYRLLIGFAIIVIVGLLLWLSLSFDRAASFDRIFGQNASEDPRLLAAPTVWKLIRVFEPFGSGAGSFDPAFRIGEPLSLLDASYMN